MYIHNESNSSEDKLSPPGWKRSNVINLPRGGWLVLPGSTHTSGAQHQFPLCTSKTLSSSSSQSSLCIFLSLRIASIPAITTILYMGTLNRHQGGWGKRPTDIHRMCLLVHLIIESFLCRGWPLLIFTWDTNTFTFIHSGNWRNHTDSRSCLFLLCLFSGTGV